MSRPVWRGAQPRPYQQPTRQTAEPRRFAAILTLQRFVACSSLIPPAHSGSNVSTDHSPEPPPRHPHASRLANPMLVGVMSLAADPWPGPDVQHQNGATATSPCHPPWGRQSTTPISESRGRGSVKRDRRVENRRISLFHTAPRGLTPVFAERPAHPPRSSAGTRGVCPNSQALLHETYIQAVVENAAFVLANRQAQSTRPCETGEDIEALRHLAKCSQRDLAVSGLVRRRLTSPTPSRLP